MTPGFVLSGASDNRVTSGLDVDVDVPVDHFLTRAGSTLIVVVFDDGFTIDGDGRPSGGKSSPRV